MELPHFPSLLLATLHVLLRLSSMHSSLKMLKSPGLSLNNRLNHALLLIMLTSAQDVGQGELNDPITINGSGQAITAIVVTVVVVVIMAVPCFFYMHHVYQERRVRRELRDPQNNDNDLQLCEVAQSWQVDSSHTSLNLSPASHAGAPSPPGDPRPPPPAYATVPRPPPYAQSPAASSDVREEQKEIA